MKRTSVHSFPGFELSAKISCANQPLFSNAGYILGVNIVPALAGFAFWGLASHYYSPSEVGIASAVISAVALVAGIAQLGVSAGIIRFLPETEYPHRLLNSAFTLVLLTALLSGGIFLSGISLWAPALAVLRQNGFTIAVFMSFIVAVTLGATVRTSFVARRQAHYALIYTFITNGVRIVLVIAGISYGASGLVGSTVLAFIFALMFSLLLLLPKVEPGYRMQADLHWPDLLNLVPYSISNHVADLLSQMTQTVLPLMILNILGSVANGHAYIALLLGSLLWSPGLAIGRSAFAEGANALNEVGSIMTKATIAGLTVTLPIALVSVVAAPWVLLLFGRSYALEASGLLRWLAIAAPMVVLNQFYFTYLRLQKKTGKLVLLSGFVVATTLGVGGLLLPKLGISAIGIGLFTGNCLVTTFVIAKLCKNRSVMSEINGLISKFPKAM